MMEADKREIARPQKMVGGGEAARARPRWSTLPSLSSKRKRLAFFPRPTPTRNTNTPRRCLLLAPPLLPLLSHHQARPASTPARPAPAFAASAALMREAQGIAEHTQRKQSDCGTSAVLIRDAERNYQTKVTRLTFLTLWGLFLMSAVAIRLLSSCSRDCLRSR